MSQAPESPELKFVRAMQTLRHRRGWSQERLAAEVLDRTGLHINPSSITKLEWALDPDRAGQARGLRLVEAFAIAQTLDSHVFFMAGDDPIEGFDDLAGPVSHAQMD